MLRIRFELDSAQARLASLFGALTGPEILLGPAATVVAGAIRRNFEEEGRPEPWEELNLLYAAIKARNYPGTKILERKGVLRDSIRVSIEPGIAGAAGIVASTNVSYAAVHQFGDRHRIVPRPFLVLTDEDREEVAQTIADVLEGMSAR